MRAICLSVYRSCSQFPVLSSQFLASRSEQQRASWQLAVGLWLTGSLAHFFDSLLWLSSRWTRWSLAAAGRRWHCSALLSSFATLSAAAAAAVCRLVCACGAVRLPGCLLVQRSKRSKRSRRPKRPKRPKQASKCREWTRSFSSCCSLTVHQTRTKPRSWRACVQRRSTRSSSSCFSYPLLIPRSQMPSMPSKPPNASSHIAKGSPTRQPRPSGRSQRISSRLQSAYCPTSSSFPRSASSRTKYWPRYS